MNKKTTFTKQGTDKNIVPSTWKELYDIVKEAYMSDSVELSTGYFDIRVKMPKRDILTAWSRLAQDINGDIVVRKEGGKTFFASDEGFIPEDEYREGYEGFASEFLDGFKDDRFHRYIPDDADDKDAEDLGEEVSFVY